MSVASQPISSHHSPCLHLSLQCIPIICMNSFVIKTFPLRSLTQMRSIHLLVGLDSSKWRSSLLRGVGSLINWGRSRWVQYLLTCIILRHSSSHIKAEPRNGSHLQFWSIQLMALSMLSFASLLGGPFRKWHLKARPLSEKFILLSLSVSLVSGILQGNFDILCWKSTCQSLVISVTPVKAGRGCKTPSFMWYYLDCLCS